MDNILDPRRNQAVESRKLYEEMLLKEMPGTSRTNEPMHAVLEGELGESEMVEGRQAQNVRNHALIHYLATLANSNSSKDTFDFDFVESLIKNGADINSTDKTGQTIFHEIARSWNVDVAKFLITKGANVNQQDQYGRSPLHVAAAVDYAEMVEFLLQNGAEIDIKTTGEGQAAIHFAAKNDAINSLHMLLGYGAIVDARDGKNRTPLQVAAEMNRCKAAKLLIAEGAPAGVNDNLGNSALSLLIEKIPEVALKAMDQFYSADTINRKEFYFLNYLEGTRLKEDKSPARTPLEIAVQNERRDIIMHPVMQRLIAVKWKIYGKWGAIQDLVLNLVYTVLWTVLAVTLPKYGRDLYLPIGKNSWRLAIGILLIIFTILEIRKQIIDTIKTRRNLKKWKEWRAAELARDLAYCHPRWPQETQYLQSEIKAVRHLSLISGSDWWIYFDWVALLFILATIASHVTYFYYSTDISKEVHQYIIIPLLMIIWFRILKYARPFEGAGPFVVIVGSVIDDITKWIFLISVIVIPFTCAFWITFGATSSNPVTGYDNFGSLVYNIFSMMVVQDHNYESLEAANPLMARLLCGAFIGIAATVTLNLLIALLSNTFERLYQNAVENAVMQRARTILLQQKSLGRKQKQSYYDFIRKKGSPEVIRNDLGRLLSTETEDASLEQVHEDIRYVMKILGQSFGKRFGKGKKSDMDFVKMDVSKVRRLQEDLVMDVKNIKIMIENITGALKTLQTKLTTTAYSANNSKLKNGEQEQNQDKNDENHNNSNSNSSNSNNQDRNNDNINNNDNVNNSSKKGKSSSLTTPKTFNPSYAMVNKKNIVNMQIKNKKIDVGSTDSDSESSSTTRSQDSSDENYRTRKKNQKHKKSKKKSAHKNRKEDDGDKTKQQQKAARLPNLGTVMEHPTYNFTQNNEVYRPRPTLWTAASYPDIHSGLNYIPPTWQENPSSPVRSPHITMNGRIFIPATTNTPAPYHIPHLGQNMRYLPQLQRKENDFTNFGFHPEKQELVNHHPVTNGQYQTNVTTQALHVPNMSLLRSTSASEMHNFIQYPHAYQAELPHLKSDMSHYTRYQPEYDEFHAAHEIPESRVIYDNSYSTTPEVTDVRYSDVRYNDVLYNDVRANPIETIHAPENSSEI